jgi:hypothetical protein
MWSDTNPIGHQHGRRTPSATSASRWSLTSGSSHGWVGGPLRLHVDEVELGSVPVAAATPAVTSLPDVPVLAV